MACVSISFSRLWTPVFALVLLTTLSGAGTARADGFLEPGEILVATGFDGHIARVAPEPPHAAEIITNEGDLSVAVASPVTIYTLDFSPSGPGYVLRVNAVNVVTGTVSLVYEFPYSHDTNTYGHIAVEPAGTIVALMCTTLSGRVVRIDPFVPDAPLQEPEVLVAQTSDIGGVYQLPSIKVASNGDIFVTSKRKLWRVDSNGLTPVWSTATSYDWWAPLDVDRKTGELLVMYNSQLVRTDPNDDSYQGTPVFENAPYWLNSYSPIALDADDNILYTASSSVFRKSLEAEPGELIYSAPGWDIEVVLPGCSNGLDDNRDGQLDHAGGDPLCTSPDVPFECSVSFGRSNGDAAWLLFPLVLILGSRRTRRS